MRSPLALTIGSFDGPHRGHVQLVRAAREAVGPAGRVLVLAFDPHPASILRPDAVPPRLSTFAQRERWLRAAGADEVTSLVPTDALLSQEPSRFLDDVVPRWKPAFIVEGPDFRFGRGRAGSIETLRGAEAEHGYRTLVIDPVIASLVNRCLVTVSSSLVRQLIGQGRVGDAAALLGRPYEITCPVVAGDGRGRGLGVPTANLDHGEMLLPADGVYAGRAARVDAGANGALSWYPAAISVGTKSTFGGGPRICEAHLVGYDGPADDYGWTIHLRITEWLRDQVCCAGVDALTAQLRRDIARTVEVVGEPA